LAKVTCYYYTTESGRVPVREFVDSLDMKTQQKFFFVKALLEEFGRRLPQPHAKYIGEDIYELRFKGLDVAVRVLYFFWDEKKAVFTNGFLKKSDKTPRKEKELAIQRRKAILEKP
jgi:phage-related protein